MDIEARFYRIGARISQRSECPPLSCRVRHLRTALGTPFCWGHEAAAAKASFEPVMRITSFPISTFSIRSRTHSRRRVALRSCSFDEIRGPNFSIVSRVIARLSLAICNHISLIEQADNWVRHRLADESSVCLQIARVEKQRLYPHQIFTFAHRKAIDRAIAPQHN